MTKKTFTLAQAMLAADPALAVICGHCACRLVKLMPEIQTAIRTVMRSRITSPTPGKTLVFPNGDEIPLRRPRQPICDAYGTAPEITCGGQR